MIITIQSQQCPSPTVNLSHTNRESRDGVSLLSGAMLAINMETISAVHLYALFFGYDMNFYEDKKVLSIFTPEDKTYRLDLRVSARCTEPRIRFSFSSAELVFLEYDTSIVFSNKELE